MTFYILHFCFVHMLIRVCAVFCVSFASSLTSALMKSHFWSTFSSSYHLSLHTTMHSLHPLSRLLISNVCNLIKLHFTDFILWDQFSSCLSINAWVCFSQAEHEKSTLGLAEFGTCVARHTEGIFVGG